MPSVKAQVATLISDLKGKDPRVYQALQLLNDQLEQLNTDVHPTTTSVANVPTSSDAIDPPTNFAVVSTGTTVRFTWDASATAFQYEIRVGTLWETASFQLRTTGLQADIDPLVYGDYTFLIKGKNIAGTYSADSAQVNITIPQIGPPAISPQVVDNNVLLYWNAPTSVFNIAYYIIKKDGSEIGRTSSTFSAIFEIVPATYTYSIIAVDVAGNESTESSVDVTVTTPTDYELQDTRTDDLSGTRVNVGLLDGPKLLACINETETYEDHFINNGWANPQAQVTAGYPIYIQPAETTGSYVQTFDYGTVINNILVAVTFNTNQIAGSTSIVVKMQVSDDDITYSSYVAGSVQFYSNFRYLRIKLEFTGADDTALLELDQLTINLTVKREVDGGEADADAGDVGGTEVFFNKAFHDIESLTVTVKETTTPYIAIYDFTDVPDPTSFFVYVYDTAGVRATKTVSWKARGIV